MNKDFKELLQIFSAHHVEYLIVGGYALIEYTEPRYTKDLDIWIRADKENARKVLEALCEFGAPNFGATVDDLALPGNVLQIGVAPLRVDILTSIDGVEFADAWPHRLEVDFDGIPVNIIGAQELLKNKRATRRDRDEEDAKLLELSLEEKLKGK